MKKLALILVLVCTFVTLFSIVPSAVELPLRVVINGTKLEFPDAQPFIDANGRTQTPARFIGEALGANVTWDGVQKKAVFESDGNTLVLYIGKREYDVNDTKKQMDTEALLIDGRTFVPARYVAEALGATVEWDASIRTVYINTKDNPTSTPTPTQGETVKYYDGVAFNDVTDVDAYGRITVEKSKEFLLNFTKHL
ncbi:MAG TPA: copper amine oxidase N-terminal domain-containing protein, partial [Acetivibrio sp.]|nr:copper amine oxidase N-terminal domain-containing protein [Acetivibrio sp.]